MSFTKLKRQSSYTDIVCVGIKTDRKPYPFSDNVYLENLHGFHTVHLRPNGTALRHHDDIITWDTNTLFDSIINYMGTRRNTLIVTNHSLVALGSSDFTSLLDSRQIMISRGKAEKEEFGYQEEGEISTQCFVASSPPTIVIFEHVHTGRRFTLVDIQNFGIKYMYDVYSSLTREEKSCIPSLSDIGIDDNCSLTCAMLIARYIQEYYKVVSNNKLGGMSCTYSSQGMKAFRYRYLDDSILTHINSDARILEENCYLGGRVEERYHGRYDGKCYLLDIQSLYPYMGMVKSFPTKLQDYQVNPPKETIDHWVKTGGVAARLLVSTDSPAWPRKHEGVLSFPVGRFNTFLCGEEFSEAWNTGQVERVYDASYYECKPILKTYSEDMLRIRSAYKGSDNRLAELITKFITNGLWGKFGQIGNLWVHDYDVTPDMQYGGYRKISPSGMLEYQYRIIDWEVSKLVKAKYIQNTFLPVSVFMNSYSRHYLYRHMLMAGLNNVLYCCVDGMIVTSEGLDRLSHLIARSPYEYGKYKISEQGDSCNIQGYGIYSIGNKVSYQGIPKYNTKQVRGFWSSLSEFTKSIIPSVASGHEVEVTECWKDQRKLLANSKCTDGKPICPSSLYEQMLTQEELAYQGSAGLFHRSEWNVSS